MDLRKLITLGVLIASFLLSISAIADERPVIKECYGTITTSYAFLNELYQEKNRKTLEEVAAKNSLNLIQNIGDGIRISYSSIDSLDSNLYGKDKIKSYLSNMKKDLISEFGKDGIGEALVYGCKISELK